MTPSTLNNSGENMAHLPGGPTYYPATTQDDKQANLLRQELSHERRADDIHIYTHSKTNADDIRIYTHSKTSAYDKRIYTHSKLPDTSNRLGEGTVTKAQHNINERQRRFALHSSVM